MIVVPCRTCRLPGFPRGTLLYCYVQVDGSHIHLRACRCGDERAGGGLDCPIDGHRIAWLQAHPMWRWRTHEAISALPRRAHQFARRKPGRGHGEEVSTPFDGFRAEPHFPAVATPKSREELTS